jgi:multiple sugar transport system permease protein
MAAIESRYKGLLFALPWILGISIFTLYPFCASIYYSFTEFSVLQSPHWVGLANFREIMRDEVFWQVLWNTFKYAGLSIPASLMFALTVSLLINACRRGQVLYSVLFYIPHLIPPTVSALLWMWMYTPDYGLLNSVLRPFFDVLNSIRQSITPGLDPKLLWGPPAWLADTTWALPALVFIGLWNSGQMAFIYLAKLQEVPQEMYEAADIDGATTWHKIRYVTLPMLSPIIFFNIVMGIIGAFQVFTEVFVITAGEGGPARSTTFMPMYIWDNAFVYFRMGYACAMSWILFLVILLLTMLAFKLSKDRVYYAGK